MSRNSGRKKRSMRRIKSSDERTAPTIASPISFQDAMLSPEERLRREQEQAETERRNRYRKLRKRVAGATEAGDEDNKDETATRPEPSPDPDIPPFDIAAVKASFNIGFDVDWAIDKLNALHEDWEGRMIICNNVINEIIVPEVSTQEFQQKLSIFIEAFGRQFADRRSLPVGELSDSLVRLVEARPNDFSIFVPFMIRSLFTCMAVRIEVMREKADALATCMVKECPYSHAILLACYDGLQHRHGETRTFCANYLSICLRRIPTLELPGDEVQQADLLTLLDQAVRLAVTDASSDCRRNGLVALRAFERVAPRSSAKIINEMSKAVRRKYDQIQRRRSSVG